ncbi:hypothetical protein [Acidipila rosea]|uniref:Uncharacterized protein n=1 Tax=Acidipila rosea TaxID=768535 RepID=A0A4R1LAU8_9BACT|nr:hypothetical protein [Acidipila rosea]TCK75586.1 hypothetical protein C7378_0572 [Acidipila rosea]
MRFVLLITTFLLSGISAYALAIDERIPDAQTLLALESRAEQAVPKEQCFLYAELVHSMTELAGQQLAQGDLEQASATLRAVEQYSQRIHMGLASNSKRLKNAEMLMRHTSFRLKEFLGGASLEDRPGLESTLRQLDRVESELMMQVFKH